MVAHAECRLAATWWRQRALSHSAASQVAHTNTRTIHKTITALISATQCSFA